MLTTYLITCDDNDNYVTIITMMIITCDKKLENYKHGFRV